MNIFRISDPGSKGYVFWRDFLKNPCSLIFLLKKLAPETIKSKKKVGFIFHPYFYVQLDPGSEIRDPVLFHPSDPGSGSGIRIRDIKVRDSDPG
jgi:hypothetical protein